MKVDHDCSLSEANVLVVQLYADPLPVHTNCFVLEITLAPRLQI